MTTIRADICMYDGKDAFYEGFYIYSAPHNAMYYCKECGDELIRRKNLGHYSLQELEIEPINPRLKAFL